MQNFRNTLAEKLDREELEKEMNDWPLVLGERDSLKNERVALLVITFVPILARRRRMARNFLGVGE